MPVRIGQVQIFPDLVLTSTDRGHKLMGTVEVETAESVNHLEAMAQWAHLGRARAPFHLYVPAGSVDIARRLAAENSVNVAEIWSFHTIGDQTRFTLVHRSTPEVSRAAAEPRPATAKRRRRRASARLPHAGATCSGHSRGRRAGACQREASGGPKAAAPSKTASRPVRAARAAAKPARAQKRK